MRNETTVSKCGNSLAIRIPLAIARQAGISEGDSLALRLDTKGGIVLRPTRRRYELSELVARTTRKDRHWENRLGPSTRRGNLVSSGFVPDAGDFIWLTFDPQAGHEWAGRGLPADHVESIDWRTGRAEGLAHCSSEVMHEVRAKLAPPLGH